MAGLRGLLALAACLLGGPAAAQQAVLEPSAAQLCLSHGGAKGEQPEYPLIAFKEGRPGRVTMALRFTGPNLRPAVTVLAKEGNAETIDSFVESVERFVRAYRVPCLAANAAPVELVFDFVFRPNDRQVHWRKPQDADADAQRVQLACLVHQSGEKGPAYPYDALRLNVQGRVLLRLRFEAADQPPVAEVLTREQAGAGLNSRRGLRLLAAPLEQWAAGYRLPCYQGRPLTTTLTFVYRIEGEAYGFKPGLTLPTLLPMVSGIARQRLDFDTTRMACPFDVQLQYLRPLQANWVAEVGSPDPARRPLLDWLAQIELKVAETALDSVFADTALITVPCMKINLNPQE